MVSMISTSALYIAARYKLKNPKETVTDEDLKNYFDQMKREHVGKARSDVKKILKNVMLNVLIADPVCWITQINERLERECLRFLWDSPDSCKTIIHICLETSLNLSRKMLFLNQIF